MAQVHAVASLGDRQHNGRPEAGLPVELAEYQHPGNCHERNAEAVVQPRCFPLRSQSYRSRGRENASAILQDTPQEAHYPYRKPGGKGWNRDGESLFPAQRPDEAAQVQANQQVAYHAAEVVEQAIGVPAGLAPKGILRDVRYARWAIDHRSQAAKPAADERNQGSEKPYPEIELQFLATDLLRPRGKKGHQQIEPEQHVNKPQVAGGVVEIP